MKASELIERLKTEMMVLGTDPEITCENAEISSISTITQSGKDVIRLNKKAGIVKTMGG